MHNPGHKPLPQHSASEEARIRKVLVLLLLSAVTALLPACGGERASSQPEGRGGPRHRRVRDPLRHRWRRERLDEPGTGGR